jgi:hypothetical protein
VTFRQGPVLLSAFGLLLTCFPSVPKDYNSFKGRGPNFLTLCPLQCGDAESQVALGGDETGTQQKPVFIKSKGFPVQAQIQRKTDPMCSGKSAWPRMEFGETIEQGQ